MWMLEYTETMSLYLFCQGNIKKHQKYADIFISLPDGPEAA